MNLGMKLRHAGILFGAFAALLGFAGCKSSSATPDTENPAVKFVQPLSGDTLVSGVYIIKAFATDNVRVKEVIFWTRGEMLGLVRYQPSDTYQLGVDPRSDTGHVYELYAEADDAAHNMGWDSVSVYINR